MKESEVNNTIEKIFTAVFNCKNPYTLDEIYDKFAFDIIHNNCKDTKKN